MDAEARRVGVAQRIHRQPRPEVGTADADVDDVGDAGGLAVGRPCARMRARACDGLRLRRRRPRRPTESPRNAVCSAGAAFGAVDRARRRTARASAPGTPRLGASSNSAAKRRAVVPLAREIRVQRADPQREVVGARRIGRDESRQRVAQARRVGAGSKAARGAEAACAGIEWLVCVSRLSRSTYTRVRLVLRRLGSSHAGVGADDHQIAGCAMCAAAPLTEITPLPSSPRIA